MGATSTDLEVTINPRGVAAAVEQARALAAWGTSRIAVWDSPSRYAESWTTLGALSQQVTGRPLGVSVTNPVTRHPMVTASAVASLHEASPAGAFLGLGTGDSGVRNLGERPATLAALEDYAACVRALLHEGRAVWHGQELTLERDGASSPPIYLAAHGPRSLALAARIGDGAIVGIGFDPASVDRVHATVADAAAQRSAGLRELDLWWNAGGIVVDDDEDRAIHRAGWLAAWAAHHLVHSRAGLASVPDGVRPAVAALAASYDLQHHGAQTASQRERYLADARGSGAWDYLSERYLIAGTPESVRSRLADLRGLGVDRISIGLEASGLDGVRDLLRVVGD